MKATVPELKRKVRIGVASTGMSLKKTNPYWMNAQCINVYKHAVHSLVIQGQENPTRRFTVTNAQKKSLDNWIADLEQKYLR